jgi:RNA polymerase sigma factor (sigma-70 family)
MSVDAARLFLQNLEVLERVALGVARRAGLSGSDAEDFVASARLATIEDDYAILRKYEGRSSLATYLAVVFRRLLADERTRQRGRWHASREAERMGAAGILLETLLRRDQRPMEEVLPLVQAAHPELSRPAIETLAARLPQRSPRPRAVEIDAPAALEVAGPEAADAGALAGEARTLAQRTSAVVRRSLADFPLEDRMLIRLRFGSEMSIADVSRMLRLPQRPLYRRIEALLARLRSALLAAGLDTGALLELLGTALAELDFGLAAAENPPFRPSLYEGRSQTSEETP